ncbi:hypothetical protein D3C81_964410 [compost metagenome]
MKMNNSENAIKRTCTILEEMAYQDDYQMDVPLDLYPDTHVTSHAGQAHFQKILKNLSASQRALLLEKLHQKEYMDQ